MKTLSITLSLIFIMFMMNTLIAQQTEKESQNQKSTTEKVVVVKNDGSYVVGVIKSKDAREILIEVDHLGEIIIPMHVIKEIKPLDETNLNSKGEYIPNEVFSTRYFVTTNGLPIEKGENYYSLHIFGPEIQFAAGKNVGIGLMTSWLGTPIIGTFKYSIQFDEQTSLALGTLAGGDFFGGMDNMRGILPFTALTFGNRIANFNLSAGYGIINYLSYNDYYDYNTGYFYDNSSRINEGRALFSIGFMIKAGKKVSIIFDSMMSPTISDDKVGLGIFIPGIRIQDTDKKAIQYGLGVISVDGEAAPFPMIQWFRKIN